MQRDPRDVMIYMMPLLLAAMMMVAGCTSDASRWTPVEAPKENRVDFIVMSHPVRFVSGTATAATGEQQGLSDFLGAVALGYGDQVTIDMGTRTGNAAVDALAAKRTTEVSDMLRKLHVHAQPASRPTVEGALNHDVVIVTVGRYVATGPNCPDHSKPESDDYTNTTQSNYGCATATNLGLMVANPGELLQGTSPGPADADFAARGVQGYRAGAMSKALKSELSSTTSGGGQ